MSGIVNLDFWNATLCQARLKFDSCTPALPGWQLFWQNSIYTGLSSWFAAKEIFNCIAFKCVAKGATFSWVEGEMGAYSSKKLLKKK